MYKTQRAMLQKEYEEINIQRIRVWNRMSPVYVKTGLWKGAYAMLRLTMQAYAIAYRLGKIAEAKEYDNMMTFDSMLHTNRQRG